MGKALEARAQGSLAPPSGTPAPTMRTLAQVEPRTPIASAPCTISQPGSYYLTTNLVATGDGIIVNSDFVTLDLMGFVVDGRGNSTYGVYIGNPSGTSISHVVVRNGAICNFVYGAYLSRCQGCRFEQLMICSNQTCGVLFSGQSGACENNAVKGCMISGNGTLGGIMLYGQGAGGICRGNTFVECVVVNNTGEGFYFNGNSGGICNGNTVRSCAVNGNGAYGIYLTSGADSQCEGNLIADCTASRNGFRGIWLNGANGNRVEGNHLYGQLGSNTYGIDCLGTSRNLIFGNTCVGQTNNFNLSSSDTYGPIVTASGALSTTNGAAGLSPWANFSR